MRSTSEIRTLNSLILLVLGACLALCCATGCRSEKSAEPARFAAAEIKGNTPGQIDEVAREVFEAHGYKTLRDKLTSFEAEKKGTAMNNLAYGGWMGDTPIWVRVKVSIVPVAEATFRLQGRAFLVRDKGGPTEEELPVSRLHSGAYQKLLEEVAARLSGKTPARPGGSGKP